MTTVIEALCNFVQLKKRHKGICKKGGLSFFVVFCLSIWEEFLSFIHQLFYPDQGHCESGVYARNIGHRAGV